ncbi:hypothetical protein MH117_03795 [Paenibacillus sp. ACRRX]|uniref:CDI toxin immunity protein n=1 Tax=Paenibacillus sp. ACRRX TaxID=2918206 RepID=UPI001EF49ABE|nr:hypothetical protein [Paenibacillus sp. ACRRX]MCG7406528.1 hypothetical protein [Paenibacillus sp. ACRRX]
MEDKNARKIRIEQLKKKIKKDVSYGNLFNECIEVLDVNSRICSHEKSQELVKQMVDEFIFTKWGRVDWNLTPHKFTIKEPSELNIYSIDITEKYFIIWNENNLPVIETTIEDIIKNFEDIVAVGFDTWIINFDEGIIIENYHEGEITIGKKGNM